jgi:thiosulfate/3-mercaptopyruvate sulfurtransferase
MEPRLPPLVEGPQLLHHLGEPETAIVDLSRREAHLRYHLPGARFLDYGAIVTADPPVTGLMPAREVLERVLGELGLAADTHVVAYDDEGGGKAARLLWTLAVLGHPGGTSLLNGGLHAWAGDRLPLTDAPAPFAPQRYRAAAFDAEHLADRRLILDHLDDPATVRLDVRSPDEYAGRRRYAERGGHIPGAVNLEWTWAMDPARQLRLRPEEELRAGLAEVGVVPGRQVVAYCQSHHRSAFAWFVLRHLGFAARGYPGGWSDWGNTPDTPVET